LLVTAAIQRRYAEAMHDSVTPSHHRDTPI
jgi:hypothetical protein